MTKSYRCILCASLLATLCCHLSLTAQVRYADSVIAFSSQYSSTNWSAEQILGPPDTYPSYGDIRTAWSAETPDDQREFIELHYANPAPVQSVAIYEIFNPGSVDTIYVRNPDTDQWQVVWSGTAAPLSFPDSRIFIVNFAPTAFNVSELRIAVNSPAVPGWNEFDAVGISSAPIVLNLPDLKVTQVQAPTEAWSGQNISVSWTVRNGGSSSTGALQWTDRVYLSPTPTLDPSAATLTKNQQNVSALDVGESYTGSTNITLPQGLNGNYYVFVYTNVDDVVAESLKSNNLGRITSPMLMHFSPQPDLAVLSWNVPRIVFASDTVNVSFTVKNIGQAATIPDSTWTDQIFLSADTLLDITNASFLTSVSHDAVLQPDSSYRITTPVIIPHDLSGPYFMYIFADRQNDVFENYLETNNIKRSDSVTIVAVMPDLAVTSVSVPAGAASGQSLQVAWTVRNQGAGVTYETSWDDRVYFSSLPQFDGGEATQVGTFAHEGALAPDSVYHTSHAIVIPNGISGPYYFYVKTDCNNVVFEGEAAAHRVHRSDSTVSISLSPWPDLRVVSLQVPLSAREGQSASLTWNVQNAGTASTPNTIWNDKIYISADTVFNGSAVFLADVPHSTPLPAHATYSQRATVTLPSNISGKAYFFVWTDGDDVVYENTDESNNVTRSDSVIVLPYLPVNLTVTAFTVPDSAVSGQTINAQWSVSNTLSGRTLSDTWEDDLYLSTDSVFNADSDIVVDRETHEGTLGAGESYSRNLPLILPDSISGLYYWFIVADAQHQTGDTLFRDNIRISSKPEVIRILPRPDLTVTSVRIDDSVYAGQPAMIRWTVRNSGAGPALAADWFDAVYLSGSSHLDKYALKLDVVQHNGPLDPLATYAESVQVTIPIDISGANYVLVQTDSRNDVAETNENNNVDSAGSVLRLAAPSDLVVTDASFPDSAEPGGLMTVTYTVRNQGINPAVGCLTDAVYVSSDSVWDATDPLLATAYNSISLAPGAIYHKSLKVRCSNSTKEDFPGSAEGELPGITPGPYHVIVRTNILDNIRETSTTNNTFVSSTVMRVDVPMLQRDSVHQSSIQQGQSKFFAVTAASGEDIQVVLHGGSPYMFLELFARYADLPSRGNYDYLYQNQNSPEQQVTLSSTQAGTYYILVHGASLSEDTMAFSITAKTMQFQADSVHSFIGGTGGEVTVSILGAKFKPGAKAELRHSGIPTADDNSDFLVSSTQLNARFPTTGLATGLYDVAVINPDHQEAVLSGGLRLDQGDPTQILVSFAGPSRLRVNSFVPLYLAVTNPTNINIQRALIYLKVRQEMRFSVETDRTLFDTLAAVSSADSLVDDEGNRVFSTYLYNLAPKHTKLIRMLVDPTVLGRYIFTAEVYVLDRTTFDSLLVVTVREGIRQGWLPPGGSISPEAFHKPATALGTLGGCPYDDAGACEAWDNRQRNMDVANDLGGVATAGAEASNAMSASPGALWKLGKFFKSLNDFFNKYKNSSGYAGDGVASLDPNDFIGPAGSGDDRWVSLNQVLQYSIRFENSPQKATAPAQTVTITMNLDTTVDANSFRLMSFGFAGLNFREAEGRSFYSQRLDCRDSLGVYVDMTAGVDVAQNRVFWTFKSTDPLTGAPPVSALVGMLPVNDSLHHGEGFVSYAIRPKSTSRTRDIISPKATIVFDINEPIGTPRLFNTIDAVVPTSSVLALPTQTSEVAINVRWKGGDDSTGSGIQNYSVYVSKNDSAFVPWLTNVTDTTGQFVGVAGAHYAFFSIATDNAGNIEPTKSASEASVFITGAPNHHDQLPKDFALEQNYPNPFNPSTIINYQLPANSRVTLKVYNLLGQVVKILADEMQSAGYKSVQWNARGIATGVYFYRLEAASASGPAKSFVKVRKMLLIK